MCKDTERRFILTAFATFVATLALMFSAQPATSADTLKRFKPVFKDDGHLDVAAVVATDPPYQADVTGKTDASMVIQRAMGDVAAQGGGTVFLPAGHYRLR